MKNRIFQGIALTALLIALAACSQSSEPGATSSDSTSSSQTEEGTDAVANEGGSSATTVPFKGEYAVGDTGPGGGIVFYATATPFPCGENLTDSCQYLEVAPESGEVKITWSALANASIDVEGNEAAGTGAGYISSAAVAAQEGNTAENSAAAYALAYTNNNLSDWYLPSSAELNELCLYVRVAEEATDELGCPITAKPRTGFAIAYYWTANEDETSAAVSHVLNTGAELNSVLGNVSLDKQTVGVARPIRAF